MFFYWVHVLTCNCGYKGYTCSKFVTKFQWISSANENTQNGLKENWSLLQARLCISVGKTVTVSMVIRPLIRPTSNGLSCKLSK